MRLLIVEDEKNLREQLVIKFQQLGYVVDEATDGIEGRYYGAQYPVDVVIVDLGLPKLSGIELIRQLRSDGLTTPILILTARSNWRDKVEGLEAGADDYLVKPFHFAELSARVTALIRRSTGQVNPIVENGAIRLDTRIQEVKVHGQSVELTAKEYQFLHYLMMHAGKVLSKIELADHLYDEDADRDSNVIEVYIGRLRRKLDPENQINPIETLRGRGYRFKPVT